MNKEEKELWLKETYDYLKNTDFDKVECQSDIYLDYIMLYEENKQLKEKIVEAIKYINKNSKNELIEEIKHFAFYKKKIKYVDISELLEILSGDSNECIC